MNDYLSVMRTGKRLVRVAGIFMLFMNQSPPAQAGNDNFIPGARSSALSGASVTLSDPWSSFSNQAGLAFLNSPTAAFHFGNKYLVKEFALQAGTFALPFKPGAFGISYRFFGYSKFYEAKFGFAYAHKLSEHFSAGVQIDYLQTHIAEGYGNYNAVTAEISMIAEPVLNFRVGFHLFNPTRVKTNAPSEERIPTVMRIGFGYSFEKKASLYFETEKDLEKEPLYKGGLEITALNNFFLRGGFSSGYEQYSFGLGTKYKRMTADLAFAKHFYLGFTPHVSFAFQFGKN